jgi:excinuclease ABC subunit C
MSDFSNSYKFEKAEQIKNIILGLEKYRSKSIIVSELQHADVLSIEESKDIFYFNYMVIKEGAIMTAYNHKISKKLQETPQEVIAISLDLLKEKFNSSNRIVITNFKLDYSHPEYELKTPIRGDKKKLLTLSLNNLKYFISNDKKKAALKKIKTHQNRILETVRKDFRLTSTPSHMECFDNSNLQGTDSVSACVVFKNGKPSKKDYRHFNVQTVQGADDFETMKEVVFRRYKRLITEKQSLPSLIIVDGGKGQLNAANDALNQLGLKNKIAIVGIAKRLEEIFFPGEKHPLYLDKRSESLKLIQFMRNEAHRFGIQHHRNKRSKSALSSDLINIKGIGLSSQKLLFKQFKTIEKIKTASYTELKEVIGESKAKLIINYYSLD